VVVAEFIVKDPCNSTDRDRTLWGLGTPKSGIGTRLRLAPDLSALIRQPRREKWADTPSVHQNAPCFTVPGPIRQAKAGPRRAAQGNQTERSS
jgi:hypothetical protein